MALSQHGCAWLVDRIAVRNDLGVQGQEVNIDHSINHSIARVCVPSDFELDRHSSSAYGGAFSRSTTVETSPIDSEDNPDILQLRETCLRILLRRLFLTQRIPPRHTFVDNKLMQLTVPTDASALRRYSVGWADVGHWKGKTGRDDGSL